MTYAEYCKTKCEWCTKGWGLSADGRHFLPTNLHAPVKTCTATTRDQFEQELQKQLSDALDALRLARPYVVRAYECAFPDEMENQFVLKMVDAAMQSAGEQKNAKA